jgi:hypothetical protein
MTACDNRATADLHQLIDDLLLLHLKIDVAYHEAAGWPDRAETIWREAKEDLKRTCQAASLHLQSHQNCHAEQEATQLRAAERAETRIRAGLADLSAVQIEGEPAGFDPRGFFVYLLWGAGSDKPLYVGQSTNVLARLGSHLGNPARRYQIERVTLVRCRTARQMDDTEMRLITKHQPPMNIAGIRF